MRPMILYRRGGVRSSFLLLCLIAAACRSAPPRSERRIAAPPARPLEQAPLIREPTVVAFWLPASDTLKQGEGADLLDDFRSYTGLVAPLLEDQSIALVTTTADSLIVELENGPRRIIRLSGLDYPFGYVLVEPGYPETILTGVSTDDELLEQITWYFGLDEEADSTDAKGRVVRTSWPENARPRWDDSTVSSAFEVRGARFGDGELLNSEPRTLNSVPQCPSTSRTRCASDPGENGFCRKAVLGSRVPCCRMASSV